MEAAAATAADDVDVCGLAKDGTSSASTGSVAVDAGTGFAIEVDTAAG